MPTHLVYIIQIDNGRSFDDHDHFVAGIRFNEDAARTAADALLAAYKGNDKYKRDAYWMIEVWEAETSKLLFNLE